MLSNREWELLNAQKIDSSIEPNKDCDDEVTAKQMNPVSQSILHNLCRICSSNGLTSIHSETMHHQKKLQLRNKNKWNHITIAKMIAEISGESVTVDDNLPQFICEHCLGYLFHAYEIREKILSNAASLRLAVSISTEESIQLESSHIDQSRITRNEINDYNDEVSEESHFYNQFRGANIKISPATTKIVKRPIEQKCPSCKKRVMSVKSLNDHMEVCEIRILDEFFSQFQNIYSKRVLTKLSTYEFVLLAIKLVFDTHKKLQKIVKENQINVDAITSELPAQDMPTSNSIYELPRSQQRSYQSPDNGYISGTNRFSPRW